METDIRVDSALGEQLECCVCVIVFYGISICGVVLELDAR
jgi:hypothetical protein